MKGGISTLTSGWRWRWRRIHIVSSNGAIGVFRIIAHIIGMYSLT
jgi:hypothetical protein